MTCPNNQTLRNYLKGGSADTESVSIESHLEDCQKCQLKIEIIAEESDSLMHLVSKAARISMTAEDGTHHEASGWDDRRIAHASDRVQKSDATEHHERVSLDFDQMIRDYRLLELIGQGGMGAVYRAVHVHLNRQVAIKVLKPDRMGTKEAISRFAREMRVLAQLEHRHIVRALDAGEHEGRPYIVMEHVNGITIRQLIQRIGPLPVPDACNIIRLTAIALQYAHEQKVIHRDVKPSNVMLTVDGDVKLLDLGLAQILDTGDDDGVSRIDQVLGTLAYMSPEQLSSGHNVSSRSDIFSLGVMLHELLTAQRPYGRPGQIHPVADVRSVRPDVDEKLSQLVQEMIALSPSERPASMEEVVHRLVAISPAQELVSLVARYYRWENSIPSDSIASGNAKDSMASFVSGTDRRVLEIARNQNGINHPPKQRRTRFLVRVGKMIAALGMVGVLIAGSIYTIDSMRIEAKPKEDDRGLVKVDADGKVGSQLLTDGAVKAVNEQGQVFDVLHGDCRLPIGKYKVKFVNCPDDFQQDGDDIEVFRNASNVFRVRPILSRPFQYPIIPEEVGSFAVYHGSIWRSGWLTEERLAFNIVLELIGIDKNDDGAESKWLRIEVTSKGSDDRIGSEDYTETAYLKFDPMKWTLEHELHVTEGWIAAASHAIEKHLDETYANAPKLKEVVVRFDRRHDLLSEMKQIPLPARRLSIYDVLALVFGQETPAAGGAINALRGMLPNAGERKTSLQLVDAGYGEQQCVVVSSREQPKDTSIAGFMMARRKADPLNPFGFVQLEVKFPAIIEANCIKKNAGVTKTNPAVHPKRLESLRQYANLALSSQPVVSEIPQTTARESAPFVMRRRSPAANFENSILALPALDLGKSAPQWKVLVEDVSHGIMAALVEYLSKRGEDKSREDREPSESNGTISARFDLATLPAVPSVQQFHGTIEFAPNHKESISARIRMLGEESIENRIYRWIDIEVTSRLQGKDYSEFARMLVDVQEYESSGELLLKKGWIAFGNKRHILSIPVDLDLDSQIDRRLQMQPKPEWNRIGIVDVTSMLFNLKLKPRLSSICTLRDEFAGMYTGLARRPTIEKAYRHKSGNILDCERWEPPLPFPNFTYTFIRSSQVPFGFVEVSLQRGILSIKLDMESHRRLQTNDLDMSAFGSLSQFNATLKSLESNADQIVPNWQVWTWKHAGKTYKAWAEFGGKIVNEGSNQVLLRDHVDMEIQVPLVSLSKENQQFVERGRYWQEKPHGAGYRVLKEYNPTTGYVVFETDRKDLLKSCNLSDLEEVDRRWIKKLHAAKTSKATKENNVTEWQNFAGYIR